MVSDPEVSSATKQLIVGREEELGLKISFSGLLLTLGKTYQMLRGHCYDYRPTRLQSVVDLAIGGEKVLVQKSKILVVPSLDIRTLSHADQNCSAYSTSSSHSLTCC